MKEPDFWHQRHAGWQARLLSPLSRAVAAAAKWRSGKSGYDAGVPVLCCGNVTVGGNGKTPVVADLAARLKKRGINAHILSHAYRARQKAPLPVDPCRHTGEEVGDEALLLGRDFPCWSGASRPKMAMAATNAGASCLILDDGLQDPSLRKTFSLLIADGGAGFGNGRTLPAGPLREDLPDAALRCDYAVLLNADTSGAEKMLLNSLPVVRAHTQLTPATRAQIRQTAKPLFLFAGIGNPERISRLLQKESFQTAGYRFYPDHHRYTQKEFRFLARKSQNFQLLTTSKDALKLPQALQKEILVLETEIIWEHPETPEKILDLFLSRTVSSP